MLLVRVGPQHLLGARDHHLQWRAQVVRELAQQPLAVIVDARQPLRERRQLRVLLREPLLHALAVGDRPALGDDERDLAVAAAQRAQQQIERARGVAGTLDPDVDVEAREAALAGGMTTLSCSECNGLVARARPPRRPPQWQSEHLGAVNATGDQRCGVDVQHVSIAVEQRDEARRLRVRDRRHQTTRHCVLLEIGDRDDPQTQRLNRVE